MKKEEYNNLINNNIEIYQEPFVHWIMKDMFEKSFYEKLKEEFPKVEDFDLEDEVILYGNEMCCTIGCSIDVFSSVYGCCLG